MGASSTIANLITVNATSTSFAVSGPLSVMGASSTIVNLQATFATATRFAVLSGSTQSLAVTPDTASTTGMIIRFGGTATTTLLNPLINAFSFATSTDGTPVFSIDTTSGGRLGLGTTAPATTFAITSNSATTTLYLDSTANRTCLQMESATGAPYRLYIDATNIGAGTPNSNGLRVEQGSCL